MSEATGKRASNRRRTKAGRRAGDGPFASWTTAELPGGPCRVADLGALSEATGRDLARLPYSIRVLLENALRHCGLGVVTEENVLSLLDWDATSSERPESAFMPARVLLQDLTGVPCVVDLAALRSAIARSGGDPAAIDPSVPVDLVIDHSLQVDYAGAPDACDRNMELELLRNGERYSLLRWAQGEFANLRVVPPGAGICHQVNLELLAEVVRCAGEDAWAFPDTVIGTDSHTTTVNGLGVLGWGVGGIEAEAVMLGQPYFMLVPQVVGVRLTGRLSAGVGATDLALTLTELLRGVGVVGRFVEYFGPGAGSLSLPDRATVANMAPEYGATCGFFPIDEETIVYLRQTGRSEELCALVEAYARLQHLFRESDSPDPEYSWVVELDLADVHPCVAGPRRPQQRAEVASMPTRFHESLPALAHGRTDVAKAKVDLDGGRRILRDGYAVIAAITSCTNTSNPSLMLTAGLLARNAVALGLAPPPWVRTSLAPGSRTVTRYLAESGLLQPLETLGFATVGYGCATCIGNSGPLQDTLAEAVARHKLVLAAVLSGNRNFEARIHPLVRANYLASPALVVAYALAGTVDIDLTREPLGVRSDGRPVFLSDLWPPVEEVARLMTESVRPELFREEYEIASRGSASWRSMAVPKGALYHWDPDSNYVREPPFLQSIPTEPATPADVREARILGIFGDSVTTDHISPAGTIAVDSPAGRYLVERGVRPDDFNTYGARRGDHEVLLRGTFANVRLSNPMAGGREGGWTTHHPSGQLMPIYDAAMQYGEQSVPLVVFAGKEYGTGSSRDWAAKGTALLGIRAVIAESFERIHRGNLVGMGVLPLELEPHVTVRSLELDGSETVDIEGIDENISPGAGLVVTVHCDGRDDLMLACKARLDSTVDVEYFRHGGVLQRVLRLKLEEQLERDMSGSAT